MTPTGAKSQIHISMYSTIAILAIVVLSEPAKSGSGDKHKAQPADSEQLSVQLKVSPAGAGVKLLEDIFQRLHNLPQLAMKKTKQALAFQNQTTNAMAPGPTDLLLAIKPKEAVERENAGKQSNQSPLIVPGGSYAKSRHLSELPLIQEFSNDRSANQRGARFVSEPLSSMPVTALSTKTTLGGADAQFKTPIPPSQAPPLYKLVREFLGGANKNLPSGNLDSAAEKVGEEANHNYRNAYGDRLGYSLSLNQRQYGDSKENSLLQIALLPPTVVNGIELVKLGASEAEACSALAFIGKASKQAIGDWIVWSLSKAHSKETLLQVYLRHGMVEAIRVFDSSAIASDLGVRLGDMLPSVKQKFGEPRFILSEPLGSSKSGQNYVYPLSQVSFQLARVPSNAAPKVVSVLIFNVK